MYIDVKHVVGVMSSGRYSRIIVRNYSEIKDMVYFLSEFDPNLKLK